MSAGKLGWEKSNGELSAWGRVCQQPAAAIRAIKPGQFRSCKEKRMSSLQSLIRDKRGGCRCCLSPWISNEGVGEEGAGRRRRGCLSMQGASRGRMPSWEANSERLDSWAPLPVYLRSIQLWGLLLLNPRLTVYELHPLTFRGEEETGLPADTMTCVRSGSE